LRAARRGLRELPYAFGKLKRRDKYNPIIALQPSPIFRVKHGVFSGTLPKIVCAEQVIAVPRMGCDGITVCPLVDSPVHGFAFCVITGTSDTLHPDLTARAVTLAVIQAKLNNSRSTKSVSRQGSVQFVSSGATGYKVRGTGIVLIEIIAKGTRR